MGRNWAGVLSVCVAAACGGSGASGTHLSRGPGTGDGGNGAPASDGGGASPPAVDGGPTGGPDGGSVGGPDGGTGGMPGGDGGVSLPDGGSLACTQDPGPPAATCSELAPGPFGPRQTFLYPMPEAGCGDVTPANGEGAFIAVEEQVGSGLVQDTLDFVSTTGQLTARVALDAGTFDSAVATGFVTRRFTLQGMDAAWTLLWYDSGGSERAPPVVVRSPETMLAFATRPQGTEAAFVRSSEDRTSGFSVRVFTEAGVSEAPDIVLADSAGVLGPVQMLFDSLGNVLVTGREVPPDRFNSTPERWAAWWIGLDHTASARFDLFGSRLDDAQVVLSSLVALADGRIGAQVYDPAPDQLEWRWTVSRAAGVQAAPCWLTSRPASRIQWIRGGRGYLVLEDARQKTGIEILTTTGDSCGPLAQVCPDCETEFIFSTQVGLDGTITFPADPNTEVDAGTCGVHWYAGAFR